MVIVTGGGGGIGYEVCRKLALQGANVFVGRKPDAFFKIFTLNIFIPINAQ